jgi:parallel beta-helix repeat protein
MSKIESEDPNTVTLHVEAAPGQVSNIMEVKNSAGTILYSISPTGVQVETPGTKVVNALDMAGTAYTDTQITNAIAALPTEGGIVWVPEGTWTMAATVTITKNYVTILCAKGAIFQPVAAATLSFVFSIDGVTDITIDGGVYQNGTGTLSYGIRTRLLCQRITLRNMTFSGVGTAGAGSSFYIGAGSVASTDILIENINIVSGCRGVTTEAYGVGGSLTGVILRNVRIDGTTAASIVCARTTDVTINKCSVINSGGAGMAFDSVCVDVKITDNKIDVCHEQGIIIAGASTDIYIAGNNVTNTEDDGIMLTGSCLRSRIIGNHCENTTNALTNCINAWTGDDHVISGNYCKHAKTMGILAAYATNVVINGNVCIGNHHSGICVSDSSSEFSVTGNVCVDNELMGITIDPTHNGDAYDAFGTVVGNTCTDCTTCYGISIEGANYMVVTGNMCARNIMGINVANSTDVLIQSNRCYSNTEGVRLGATTVLVHVFDNDLSGNAAAVNIIAGAATYEIRGNVGWVTENFGTGVVGTGAQQDIDHGLAAIPTRVILSEDTTGGALAYQSAAADANHLKVTATLNKTFQWEAKVR